MPQAITMCAKEAAACSMRMPVPFSGKTGWPMKRFVLPSSQPIRRMRQDRPDQLKPRGPIPGRGHRRQRRCRRRGHWKGGHCDGRHFERLFFRGRVFGPKVFLQLEGKATPSDPISGPRPSPLSSHTNNDQSVAVPGSAAVAASQCRRCLPPAYSGNDRKFRGGNEVLGIISVGGPHQA